MTTENLPAYFETWSEELISRSNRVRNLIGDRHWLSDGTYKELLVKEFLRRHVPRSLDISRGFVRKLTSEEISPETDILITDSQKHVPLFNEGDLQIVTPSSVVATFEVKSQYSKSVLSDALTNVARVRIVSMSGADAGKPWSAIFIFDGDKDSQRLFESHLRAILVDSKFWTNFATVDAALKRTVLLPSIVCIATQFVAFLGEGELEGQVEVRVFDAGVLAGALAFAQLFLHLRSVQGGASYPGELDSLLMRIDHLSMNRFTLEIPPP